MLRIYSIPIRNDNSAIHAQADILNDLLPFIIPWTFRSDIMEDVMECVKSHIALSRWGPSWLLCSAVPGDHMWIDIYTKRGGYWLRKMFTTYPKVV